MVCFLCLQLMRCPEHGEKSKQPKLRLVMKPQKPSARRRSRKLNAPSISSTRNMLRRRREQFERTSTCACCVHVGVLGDSYSLIRESEEEFLQSLTDSLSAGTTWERICSLIDLQNSQSKTLARTGANTTDLTRFKEVLLRLKREGEAAPGAAGY